MLSGFDNAVGPIQPREQPQTVAWPCQIAFENNEDGGACRFQLFDGGVGRAYILCETHNYRFFATDWTAPNFTNKSLGDYVASLSAAFERIRAAGYDEVQPGEVTTSTQKLGDLFDAILRNVEAVARELEHSK